MEIQYVGEIEYPDGYTGDHILDFDNFSPYEMDRILYHPFSEDCPFHLGEDLGDLDDVPLLNHMMVYLEYMKENSPLKLTQKGNLPLSFCRYLVDKGLMEGRILSNLHLNSEEDIAYLTFMKMITWKMGLVSKRYNRFSLSGKGKKFLKLDDGERYRMLFKYMTTVFNWGYFDWYPYSWIVQGGFAFSIFLFQKYGDEKRPPEFYSMKFRIAFPGLYRDFDEWRGPDPIMGYERAYNTRVIERFLNRMGLVEVEYDDENRYDPVSVRKKPLIDRVIGWDRDVFDFDREGYIREKKEEMKKRIEMEKKRKPDSKYGRKILSRTEKGKSKLYTLKVYLIQGPLTEGFEELVSRTIQIRGDQTLEDLHNAIFKVFDRWEEHMYEFLLGEGPFDRSAVYSLPFGTDPELDDSLGSVEDTTIDSLGLEEGRAFGYRFDFGDDWLHQIDVVGIDKNESSEKYPRIIETTGKSPPQYPDPDEE
jgi:hypothetical protein